MKGSHAAALFLLAWLLVCPLASSGLFVSCHEGEASMDCCKDQESPKVRSAPAQAVALLGLLDAVFAPQPWAAPAAAIPSASATERVSLLQVFRL